MKCDELKYEHLGDANKRCVPLDDLKKYQGNKEKIFGWICGVFEKFEHPKTLADFGLKRPPQSWQYVEV